MQTMIKLIHLNECSGASPQSANKMRRTDLNNINVKLLKMECRVGPCEVN